MGMTRKMTKEKAGKPVKAYVFAIDEKTGNLYLKQYRAPFWDELPYAMVLVATVVFALISCCHYIQISTSIECRMRQTSRLQSEYWALLNENNLQEKEMNQISNLNEIYETAVNELGMIPAQKEHVLLYKRINSEFVYQTDNIPNFTIH